MEDNAERVDAQDIFGVFGGEGVVWGRGSAVVRVGRNTNSRVKARLFEKFGSRASAVAVRRLDRGGTSPRWPPPFTRGSRPVPPHLPGEAAFAPSVPFTRRNDG